MTGGDSRLVEDHQAASQLAIRELERFAVRRLREGVHFDSEDVVRCGNITALRYDHTAARGVGGQIDPQVHTHFLIANRVQDPASKKWYALSEREMASAAGYAKEVYRNELARRLKGHGYGIENRKRGFGISGIHEDDWSKSSPSVQITCSATRLLPGSKPKISASRPSGKSRGWSGRRAKRSCRTSPHKRCWRSNGNG